MKSSRPISPKHESLSVEFELTPIGGRESVAVNLGSAARALLVSGLDYSTYALMVMDGETILHQEIGKTYSVGSPSSKLEIDVSRRK